jgi:RNA polymerase sigma-70 factor (ECF subfamily)
MSAGPQGRLPPDRADPPGQGGAHVAVIESLFREHNEALIRFLMTRLRSHQEAHEVAQEAYVRLLSLHQPGAVSYLRAFLYKTAANLATDRLRREDVHDRATALPLFHEFADALSPERQVAGVQEIQRLERLLDDLPPKCRQAFVLNRFYGMDFTAVAQEMGLKERMVRTYVVRALLYCRSRFDIEPLESNEFTGRPEKDNG